MNLWADEMRERSNERWGRTDLGEAAGARAVRRCVTIRVGATTGDGAANLGT